MFLQSTLFVCSPWLEYFCFTSSITLVRDGVVACRFRCQVQHPVFIHDEHTLLQSVVCCSYDNGDHCAACNVPPVCTTELKYNCYYCLQFHQPEASGYSLVLSAVVRIWTDPVDNLLHFLQVGNYPLSFCDHREKTNAPGQILIGKDFFQYWLFCSRQVTGILGIRNGSSVAAIREQSLKSPLAKGKRAPQTQSNVRFKYLNIWLIPESALDSIRHSLDAASSTSAVKL